MSRDFDPVIIGVGEVVNRSRKVEDAREPLSLMLEAIQNAITDSGLPDQYLRTFKREVDSLDIVNSWTWPYPDLPALISKKLDISPSRRYTSPDGGNQPGLLLDQACQRITRNESKFCILTGGEALASRLSSSLYRML